MSKDKPSGGKHKTLRKPVVLTAEWHAIAEELAAEQKMPVAWYVTDLLRAEAELKGIPDLPVLPWATDKERAEKKPKK